MSSTRLFGLALLVIGLVTTIAQTAPEIAPSPRVHVDLTGYRTVLQATKANPKEFNTAGIVPTGVPGFIGVLIGEKNGKPVIEAIAPESPAEAAGLKEDDLIVKIGNEKATTAPLVRESLRTYMAGDNLKLTVSRKGTPIEATVVLRPASKPLAPATGGRPVLGVTLGGAAKGGGVKLDDITVGGPAAKAGLKVGDVILKIDGKEIEGDNSFREYINTRSVGDQLDLIVLRGDAKLEYKAGLENEERPNRGGGWDDRIPRAWRKPTYNLAILGVEYPDVKHNSKITDSDWEESMFSIGTYHNKSATGEKVYGSMNDYYKELSHGAFQVEGKFIGWV
jgi:S1-C subfamily serine protease